MSTEGVVRKIDKLGRIVIPAEFRKTLGIELKEDVEIMLEGSFVKVCKHENGCIFCGEKTTGLPPIFGPVSKLVRTVFMRPFAFHLIQA